MKTFLKNYKYLFLAILISTAVNFRWLSASIFAASDYTFQFFNTLAETPDFGIWNTYGLGNVNLLPWRLAGQNNLLFGLFGSSGFDSHIADKFLLMLPWIFLSVICSFLLVKKITQSNIGGFAGSCVFSFSTYFLAINNAGHLLLSLSSIWVVFSLLLFIKTLEEKKLHLAIITALSLFITASYDFRNLYIAIWILLLYFLFFSATHKVKSGFVNLIITACFALLPIIILLALSTFWVIPASQSGFLNDNTLLSRDLFGSNFYNITRAITLFQPFWTGGTIEWFVVQKIPHHFWLLPIIACLGLILNKKNKNILFFGIISLIGIFLAKQAGEPFGNIYQVLFENLPGFNAFREASKFYLLIIIGYSVLIGSFVAWLWKNYHKNKWQKYGQVILTLGIILILIWNVKPIITGEIGSMFIPRQMPNDYLIFKNFILKQNDFFRTLWIPNNPRWAVYTNEKPLISAINVINNEWKDYTTLVPGYKNLPIDKKIAGILKIQGANQLLDASAIKYIAVPSNDFANNADPFYYYGRQENSNIRNWYLDQLNQIKWLKKIDIGTKDLIIYENTSYKPYFFTLNTFYNFDYLGDLTQKSDFITQELKNNFNFTAIDAEAKQNIKPLTLLKSLYAKIEDKNIDSDLLTIKDKAVIGDKNNSNELYVNQTISGVHSTYANNVLELHSVSNGILKINGEMAINNNNSTVFYKKQLDSDKHFLTLADALAPITAGESQYLYLADEDKQIKLYTAKENMIDNSSFEKGLWQDKVGDCNKYDKNGLLAMNLNVQEKTDGNNSLQLEATRHIACTSQKFKIDPGTSYAFSFDYQSPAAKMAGFYIQFNDKNQSVINGTQNISDEYWHNFLKKIDTPDDATFATLYVYAYASDNQTNNIVRYDNFGFTKLKFEDEIKITQPQKTYTSHNINLKAGENIFSFKDDNYNYQNIFKNGSFENGTWSAKVIDCHNYDKNPIISMSLDNKQKSAGNYSLKLSAQKHIACSNISIPITSNSQYLLNFDYQSDNAYNAGYFINYKVDKTKAISETLPLDNDKWNKLEKMIKTPNGADSLTLYIYAYATDNKKNNIVRYDNFQLSEIPDLTNKFYLVSSPQATLKEPSQIEFKLINPAKKIIFIKGATTPFFLAMSESYNNKWQLELKDDKNSGTLASWWPFSRPNKIEASYHYKLNNYLNAWYISPAELCKNHDCQINPDGSYDIKMVAEFWPQRWFCFGLIISSLSLLGCILYLTYIFYKKYGAKN